MPCRSDLYPSNPAACKTLVLGGMAAMTLVGHSQTLYDFGNPGREEQLYIELVNRARANPPAEGARLAATTDPGVLSAYSYFGVNLAMMQNEFNAIAAQPPLAPNASLTTAARNHSAWMLANATQSHNETNPSNTPFTRMTDAGYAYSDAGENVFAYSNNTWFGHAGFQVDWGAGSGGMQTGRGHRANIHSGIFREIGVGVVEGSNGGVGPQLVTQDFGYRSTAPSFGTGVAYYDLNGNDFYDAGEGISGLTVNVTGASYYCTTAAGGGWTVPIPSSAATRTVTFSGLGLNQGVNLVVPSSQNAKADLKLAYTAPAITSSSIVHAGAPHSLQFTAVGGATGYQWKRGSLAAAAAENCESTAGITSSTTGSYAVRNTSVKQEGTSSFHLENSTGGSQSIELNGLYYGGSSPALSFQSRLRTSTSSEHFKVQIKEEGSSVWLDVYGQTGGSAESSFSLRNATLTGMAGKLFRVRFLLSFNSGSYYPYSGNSYGWFIDAITFSNVSNVANQTIASLATNSGSFIPEAGTYLMSVAPVISGIEFPASHQILTVTNPPPPSAPSFDTWAADLEIENALPDGALANPHGDFDHDGRPNLIEYAFGSSPIAANDPASAWPAAHTTATHFVLQYKVDTSRTDVIVTPQACSSLGDWKAPTDPGAPTGFADVLISTAGSIQTREARVPSNSPAGFLRVSVSRP